MKKLILLLTVLLILTSCGKKAKGFTAEELEEIHAKEASLKQQLVNKTWHYYSEPSRAVRYLEDGSYENYLGPGIRYRDYFSGDDGTWDIKYCGTLDGDTSYLETDKEKAKEYYDYNVFVTYVNYEGKTRTYTQSIRFDGNELFLEGDELYEGPAVLEHMPEGLRKFELFPDHVWYIDSMECYALFFADGYCYMTHGVFADGLTNASYIYRWGVDDDEGLLYLMDYYKEDDKVYEDVQIYAINGALEDNGNIYIQLVDTWSNGETMIDMHMVDGTDNSAIALLNSYDQLHNWTIENWENLS